MYENNTFEVLRKEMLEEITLTDKREGSYVSDMLSTAALKGEKLYVDLEHALAVAFLKDCRGIDADERAKEEGLTRKEGTKAKGIVTFTGDAGKEIPEGTLCGTANDLHYMTTAAVTIGEDGTASVSVEAAEIGDRYNVLAGHINTLPVSVSGVVSVENNEGMKGGSEAETDAELVARVLLKKRQPGTSGNIWHYLEWALEVPGVGNARVFPLDNGPGTVGVMPVTSGGRAPGGDILADVLENIENKRPIGATPSVYAPEEVIIHTTATITISGDTTVDIVKAAYKEKFDTYIKEGVFVLQNVDYYKCLSMFYEISGVVSVQEFKLNGGEDIIPIGQKQIQVAGEIEVNGR